MTKLLSIIVLNLLLSSVLSEREVKLLNSDIYMLHVTQQFVYELEDFGVCNTKIKDINHKISRTNYFGLDVVGTVNFTNGFINTLQGASLRQDPNAATINPDENSATMSLKMEFTSLTMYYDYFADLTAGKFSGVVALSMKNVEFILSMKAFLLNNTIIHGVNIVGASAANRIWDFVPSNKYTEVINKDVKFSFFDSNSIVEKFWNTLLGKAIKKVPFPRLCLNC